MSNVYEAAIVSGFVEVEFFFYSKNSSDIIS